MHSLHYIDHRWQYIQDKRLYFK